MGSRMFGVSNDITDVLQDSENLVEFLISNPDPPYGHRPDGLIITTTIGSEQKLSTNFYISSNTKSNQ